MKKGFWYKFNHKKYFRTLVLRWAALGLAIALTIPVLGTLAFSRNVQANENIDDVQYKYYKYIEIEDGDTLWSIANQYCGKQATNQEIKKYINEICDINHLTSDTIISGQHLTVYYFSTEYK